MNRREFVTTIAAATSLRAATEPSSFELVYTDGRSLFLKRGGDGNSSVILTGSRLAEPRFSSSGQWIAYREGEDAFVVPASGGKSFRLGQGKVVWSPAADVLAFASEQQPVTFRSVDGSGGWKSIGGPSMGTILPVFSPDGKQIATVSTLIACMGAPCVGSSSLTRAKFASGTRFQPIAATLGELVICRWTRDSKRVLYWVAPEISVSLLADGVPLACVSVDSGRMRHLGVDALVHSEWIVEAPTRPTLAIVAGKGRESWYNKRIALYDLATETLRYVTGEKESAIAPAWSPDGSRIAYAASPGRASVAGGEEAKAILNQRRVFIQRIEGGPAIRASRGELREECPIWLDASRLLLFQMDAQDRGTLRLIDLARRRETALTEPLPVAEGWFGYYGYLDCRAYFDSRYL